MDPKHIVIDARILRTSTGRYVERLLHYLQLIDKQNNYTVLLAEKDFDGWTPTNPNFSKISVDYAIYSPKALLSLGKFIQSLDADLVHFPFQIVPPNYRSPFVVTIHDLTQLRFKNLKNSKTNITYTLKQALLSKMFKMSIKHSRAILTDTNYVKKDLITTYNALEHKIHVVYLSADEGIGLRQDKILEQTQNETVKTKEIAGKEFITYVGTGHSHKNLDKLVEAFMLLQRTRPNLHLVLAGKHDNIYKEFLKRTDLQKLKNFHALGFVSDAELIWLYNHASAYVFPSLSEGFGLPGLEAMQYDCPVVSSNATCLPEVYGDAAHYFDPSDAMDMARAINDVLTDPRLREKLIKNGRTQLKKYSWEKMARETLAIYEKALDGTTT